MISLLALFAETLGAENSAPYAIVLAISSSAVMGFALILSLIYSIQVAL